MVREHNRFRRLHSAPDLALDPELDKEAQGYAAKVAKHGSVQHSKLSDRPDTGESIAEMCTKEGVLPAAKHVVNRWYLYVFHF